MVGPAPLKVLGYADDALFFLTSFNDFHQLQNTLALYSRASNAKVNYHKTEVISLSGASQPEWQELLQSAGINAWHDYQSLSAIHYLGYPLASTSSQLNAFLEGLLVKLRIASDIHLQRGLSIQGRSTVINTLILSKIWHVLRVTPVPQQFHLRLRSLVTRFLMYKMFPPVRYSILTLPKYIGGLGILDSKLQQQAMQIRWLSTLFSSSSSSSFLSSFLSHFLISTSQCIDPLLPLLFPSLRPPILRSMRTLSPLFSAIDEMDVSDNDLNQDPSMSTCLLLPLEFVIQAATESSFVPKKRLSSLRVSDAYIFDSSVNHLRPRRRDELSVGRGSIIHLFRALEESGEALVAAFLARALVPQSPALESESFYLGRVDFQPLYTRYNINKVPLHTITSRTYRSSRQLSAISIANEDPDYPSLTKRKWKFFWKARMLPAARSIWWRSIHNKISCRSILHSILPESFEDNLCVLRDLEIESVAHFLFSCDSKWMVWQQVLLDCLLQPVSKETISDAIFSLEMPSWGLSNSPLSAVQIISGIMIGIWRAHWLAVFSFVPFNFATVINSTHKILTTLRQEETLTRYKPP